MDKDLLIRLVCLTDVETYKEDFMQLIVHFNYFYQVHRRSFQTMGSEIRRKVRLPFAKLQARSPPPEFLKVEKKQSYKNIPKDTEIMILTKTLSIK